jgi:hypothetical protein
MTGRITIFIMLATQVILIVLLAFNLLRGREVETNNYENEAKIQELEHEKKLKDIEIEYLHRLHFVENADSTQLDSVWNVYGF